MEVEFSDINNLVQAELLSIKAGIVAMDSLTFYQSQQVIIMHERGQGKTHSQAERSNCFLPIL
jgi:hypothetical protein